MYKFEDLTAADVMASPPIALKPEDSVFDALEVFVDRKVSGVPVLDAEGKALGVISGYDVLALDSTPGHLDSNAGMFPPVGDKSDFNAWEDFRTLKALLAKAKAETVGEVMRPPVTIPPAMLASDAADVIVQKRLHRLLVADEEGVVIGVLSRGDIMRAYVKSLREAEAA